MKFIYNGKERKLFEQDVGPNEDLKTRREEEQTKEKLMEELKVCLKSLDDSIDKNHHMGKVPIGGFYFDARYAKNLSNLMHDVINGKEKDFKKAAEFINLQLITASKCWRTICAKLYEIT